MPEGVDLVSVATSIDPTRPNYPPDAWLQREGWTAPVIADTTNAVAEAYGLTAFPYWVFVGPDGKVVARAIGGDARHRPGGDAGPAVRRLTETALRTATRRRPSGRPRC